jgi:hypothetical protein
MDDKMRERFAQIREDYYLPPFDEDGLAELGEERFILFERGHYGQTWVSTHGSPADASDYSLNQECAEDWEPTVILDRESGEELVPRTIEWETTTARASRAEQDRPTDDPRYQRGAH